MQRRLTSFHPRIRGAHLGMLVGCVDPFLSSPHTRGTRESSPKPGCLHPFIPAYAGHTRSPPYRCRSLRFHPRIRGAHRNKDASVHLSLLSSPHTRGTRARTRVWVRQLPFIPAYAGHTFASASNRSSNTFHPRIRGAHGRKVIFDGIPILSSPHTRGTRPHWPWRSASIPFIPAYAGHTMIPTLMHAPAFFHPRIRGAHSSC